MQFKVEIKPRAIKDLHAIPKQVALRILNSIKLLENNLQGNVKRLTNFTPEYRLRVGNYRILFEVEEGTVIVYRVKHRQESYR